MTAFFSVVIPLFNKQDYLARCIDSVLAQTFTDFELIVVDDGSTDSSVRQVKRYMDPRIRLVSQDNQGPGAARNRGISESHSEWISFIDADDAWKNVHLEELRRAIAYDQRAGIVTTRIKECLTKKNIDYAVKDNKNWIREMDYFMCVARQRNFINSSSMAIKRRVLEEIGGFKNWYISEDTELIVRICLRYPCVASNLQTVFYFRGTGGIMETRQSRTKLTGKSITDISELNPAVALVVHELQTMSAGSPRRWSLVQYINSKVTIAVKRSFYQGNVDRAKQLGRLYITPTERNDFLWCQFLKLPLGTLAHVARGRIGLRWVYRSQAKGIYRKIRNSF